MEFIDQETPNFNYNNYINHNTREAAEVVTVYYKENFKPKLKHGLEYIKSKLLKKLTGRLLRVFLGLEHIVLTGAELCLKFGGFHFWKLVLLVQPLCVASPSLSL